MNHLFMVLKILDNQKIHYIIERTRADTVQINAAFVGARLEIEIFEDDHIEVSRFIGNEDVDSISIEMLQALVTQLA